MLRSASRGLAGVIPRCRRWAQGRPTVAGASLPTFARRRRLHFRLRWPRGRPRSSRRSAGR
eukprot:11225492-Lingulodinium_polyedra.AAC.1